MVRIRLRRNGLKGQASYRIIAADKESPRDGRFLEILGSYNPRTEPFDFKVKEERVYHWMKNGAQPSESVAKLFKSVGLDERFARYKAEKLWKPFSRKRRSITPTGRSIRRLARSRPLKLTMVSEKGGTLQRNTSGKTDPTKSLVEYIALSLVDDPSSVKVTQQRSGNRIRLELQVAKEDMGRIIGKSGKVANSIRVLLRVASNRSDRNVTLDVLEPNH